MSPYNPPEDCSSRDRRKFLAGVGAAMCTAGLASPDTVAADEPKQTDRPTGVEGIRQLLAGKRPLTWVLTGDSITHGAKHTLGWRSYPEHFAERLRWEMRRMKDVVINTGISGDRTGPMLEDLDWRVLRFKPDVASVMLGMNDCTRGEAGRETFRANLRAIADKAQAAGAICVLHTPNTIHVKNSPGRGDLAAYAQIVREVAAAGKFVLVDHFAHWSKAKSKQDDLLAWLEDKSVHPGVYGHREFAKLMFRELGMFDTASPTCQLEVP